ncbi:unnamed protein product, partial [Phaeothamnion confervicola]
LGCYSLHFFPRNSRAMSAFVGGGRKSARGNGGASTTREEHCACRANDPLLNELRQLAGDCVRTGRQPLRLSVLRAIKSVKRYPLPIRTHEDACALEGVGGYIAQRMMRGMRDPSRAPPTVGDAMDVGGSLSQEPTVAAAAGTQTGRGAKGKAPRQRIAGANVSAGAAVAAAPRQITDVG